MMVTVEVVVAEDVPEVEVRRDVAVNDRIEHNIQSRLTIYQVDAIGPS